MNSMLRILMLEDTPTDAELAERELRNAGMAFTSLRVETREAFVRALKEFCPDIVLSDYNLPDLDGMAALKLAQFINPEIPVIMVTGALTDVEAVKLIHAGAKDYVLKGRLARLASSIQQVLAAEQSIRARKQAEALLIENEAKYRAVFDSTRDMLMMLDAKGFFDANRAALLGLGCASVEEFSTKTFVDFASPFQPNGTSSEILLKQHIAIAYEKGFNRFEWISKRLDNGELFSVDVMFTAMEQNDKHFLLVTARDISERKLAEQERSNSMRQLEVKELAKSRFLAAAGHDLRQPLSAANLFIDALKNTELSPDQDQIVHRLGQAMSNFNVLLDALLNVSKLDAGIIKPVFTSIRVDDIFKWLKGSFASLIDTEHVRFKIVSKREELAVSCDIGLLQSVLMNLVSNAVKFTFRGGILVSARPRGGEVLFQVWDTGIGIHEEDQERIFDDFYQVSNSQRDRTKGLGLGLSIVKRTLALFEGEINCRSQMGRGSVFSFRLPGCSMSSDNMHDIGSSDAAELEVSRSFVQGKRFMVIEDDVLVSEALSNSLRMMGGEVKCFENAEYALQYPGIGNADCYIADYMLPNDIDGINFLLRLRQKLRKPICAVMMSGNTSSYFIRKAEFFDWPVIHKPVNLSKLIFQLSKQAQNCSAAADIPLES